MRGRLAGIVGASIFVLLCLIYTLRANLTSSTLYDSRVKLPGFASLSSNKTARANAAFVILARNSDLAGFLESVRNVEDRFNHRYHYPYVFLNDQPFSEAFISSISALASGDVYYGIVPQDEWREPSWINETLAAESREAMAEKQVLYADSVSYRRMCRYQSGWFWRHPMVEQFDYYWRLDPNVKYFCNIDYDPFLYMHENNKKYSFTVTIKEYKDTITTLWDTTKQFMKEHPEYVSEDNSMYFLSEDDGESYNLCHMWSNFEIASLEFLRSKAYRDYFDYLDRAGGFSYERWGDAPVHSIAAGLFLRTDQIHFFKDIGYRHEPFQHCPKTAIEQGCWCDPKDSFEDHWYSCTTRWHELAKQKGLE